MRDEPYEHQERTLEALRVAARVALGPQMAHDLELKEVESFLVRTLIYELTSFVYQEKIDHEEVVVPFSKTATAYFPNIFYLISLEAAMTVGVAAIVAVTGGSYLASGVALAMLVATFVFALLNPKSRSVTARGEARVSADYWHRFPENTYVIPEPLGNPVRYITYEKRVRYEDVYPKGQGRENPA